MSSKPEVVFDLEDLLRDFTTSFAAAAKELHSTQQTSDLPFIYHMPKMSVEVELSLSYSKERVKGYFSKTRSEDEQEMVSKIKIDVVAVPAPRTLENPGGSG